MRTINYFQSRIEAIVSPMDCVMMSKDEPQNYILIDVRNAPPHLKEAGHPISGTTFYVSFRVFSSAFNLFIEIETISFVFVFFINV